jgi:O-antigen/teichoic acid export membrane protein
MILLRLDAELLGTWGILKAAVIFPLFLQSALSVAIFLQTSREAGRTGRLSEALAISLVFSVFVGAILIVCAPYLAAFFRVPVAHIPMAVSAFRISGITFVIVSLASVFEETLQAHGRFDIANLLSTLFSLVNSAGSILLLHKGHQILSLITLDLFTNCLFLVAAFILCARVTKQLPSLFSVRGSGLVSLTKETSAQLVYAVFVKLLWELDALIIPRVFGIQRMASYWIGQRLAYAWKGFLWAGIWPAVPEAVEDSPETKTRLAQIHWMQVGLAIPIAAALIYFAAEIIRLWTSQQDVSAIFVLRMLTVAVLIDFFPATYMSIFFARGKVALLSRFLLAGVLIKLLIAAAAWISQDFRLMISSTVAGAAIFSSVVMFSVCGKNWARWQEMLKPAVSPLLAVALCMALFSQVVVPGNWVLIIGCAAMFLVVSFLLTLFFMQLIFRKSGRDFLSLFLPGTKEQ